ncbi:hypothetical protein TRFO_04634 [Tritrichomonas foetus]|uniref:Uncharacterized protein n=1 Tax=Tritrichomonas foetus TaxID=1144522 RepID=A0A1J4KDS8_9EUKA|nr:hypothetical protein TRFO_04634 [Tritrichomonas foetus]|eukprot:OHT09064.1 hypothetical protein TRFO_04634 [Tritrichomonas foetus]
MELISQISSSTAPIPLIKQFVQTIYEHPEANKEALRRLFCALRAKNQRHRANIAVALSQLLAKIRNSLDLDYVYEFSKEVLLQDSTTAENRRSNIALFFAWNAMCRAGIFRNRHDIVEKIIQMIHGISNENECYKTIGYSTLWSVIESTYRNTDEFKSEMFNNLVNEMGPTVTPPHADSFGLWVRIARRYSGLPLKKWAGSPVSQGTFRSLASLLEKTTRALPQIHPVWRALAEVDPNQLIFSTMELWEKKKKPDGYLPMIASIAAFDHLEVQHFIDTLEKRANYYMEINSSKYGELLSEAILQTATKHAKIHKHRLVALSNALLKCVRSTQLGKFLGQLDDGETKELLGLMTEHKFDAFCELLWAQTRRESLEDSSLVTQIFQATMNKIEKEEDRQKLVPFLSHCVDSVAGDGKHWLTLISPESQISGIIISKEEVLYTRSNSILEAAKKIHEIVGLEIHEKAPKHIKDLDSLVDASLHLLKSKCKFCQAIGRSFATCSLQYIDEETLNKFENEPLVMIKALTVENLSAKAIPLLFKKLKLLPHKVVSRPEKIVINITSEGIEEALPALLRMMRETQPKGFHVAVAQMLIDKLDENNRKVIVDQVIEDQIGEFSKSQTDFIPLFIRASFETAHHVLEAMLERLKSDKSQACVRRTRGWFEEISDKYELPLEEMGKVLGELLNFPFDDKKLSDRKKAEDALGWTLGFLSQNINKEIPVDDLQPFLEKFEQSKSRKLVLLCQSLRNPEGVIQEE